MRKSAFIAIGAFLVAGSALASNTGFKLNYPLSFLNSKTNWVSLPTFYFPNGNVSVTQQNSLDVCWDTNDFVAGAPKVSSVSRWQTAPQTPLTQSCVAINKATFNLVKGEAYSLVPAAASVVINLVGSNDDGYAPNKGGTSTYPLTQNSNNSNLNWVSVPYHTTADNSVHLCIQWNAQNPTPAPPAGQANIASVTRWLPTDVGLAQSCVALNKAAYNITPGEGYAIVPRIPGLAVSWNVY